MAFGRALVLALEYNPYLIAAGQRLQIAAARVPQYALRPNPQIGIVLENFVDSGPFSELGATETTVCLAWVLERGKRERRIARAKAGAAVIHGEKQLLRLDVVADTARLFLRCVSFEQKLRQAGKAIALAESVLDVIVKRVATGRSPSADKERAAAELARMHLEKEQQEHRLSVAVHCLTAHWGENAPHVYVGVSRHRESAAPGELRNFTDPATGDARPSPLFDRATATRSRASS